MTLSSISTEPHPATRALPYSRGKASKRPAFTPVLLSYLGLISQTKRTERGNKDHRCLSYWQGEDPLWPLWPGSHPATRGLQ